MAVNEYLARDFKFSVAVPATTPTYIVVKGVSKWGLMEGEAKEVDVTDFDDNGWESQLIASRKAGVTIEGNDLRDPTDGAMDPGQALIKAAARKMGVAGTLLLKIEPKNEDGGSLAGSIIGTVNVKPSATGGGNDDKMPFSYDLPFRGKPALTGIFDPEA